MVTLLLICIPSLIIFVLAIIAAVKLLKNY